jgi:hypothetical protein
MAFPNTTITDIVATTLAHRSKRIADNVTASNALLARLSKKGKIRTISGGRTIYEPILFAENGNGGWYSGYDTLSVTAQDVISGAEFGWKQYAVPVVISGLEELENDGPEQVLSLIEGRMQAAEATMKNDICTGLYSDGTGSGGKIITGLDAAVPQDPTTGTYGGIDRSSASNTFWRSQLHDYSSTPTATTVQAGMNTLWALCVRGADQPDLIMSGSTIWATYLASLQVLQRFTSPQTADLGFPSIKFMNADVVLDTSTGVDAQDMYFLNTDYLHFRPHSKRNMVPLDPKRRYAVNQDAAVQILAWAGNLTCSGSKFQGRLKGD